MEKWYRHELGYRDSDLDRPAAGFVIFPRETTRKKTRRDNQRRYGQREIGRMISYLAGLSRFSHEIAFPPPGAATARRD